MKRISLLNINFNQDVTGIFLNEKTKQLTAETFNFNEIIDTISPKTYVFFEGNIMNFLVKYKLLNWNSMDFIQQFDKNSEYKFVDIIQTNDPVLVDRYLYAAAGSLWDETGIKYEVKRPSNEFNVVILNDLIDVCKDQIANLMWHVYNYVVDNFTSGDIRKIKRLYNNYTVLEIFENICDAQLHGINTDGYVNMLVYGPQLDKLPDTVDDDTALKFFHNFVSEILDVFKTVNKHKELDNELRGDIDTLKEEMLSNNKYILPTNKEFFYLYTGKEDYNFLRDLMNLK